MRTWLLLMCGLTVGCGASVVIELDTDQNIEDNDPVVFLATDSNGDSVYGDLPASCSAGTCSIRHTWDERPGEWIEYMVWIDSEEDDLMELGRMDVPEGTLPEPDWNDPAGTVKVELKGATYTQRATATLDRGDPPLPGSSDPGTGGGNAIE